MPADEGDIYQAPLPLLEGGEHVLQVRASDSWGNLALSEPRTVRVRGVVSAPLPIPGQTLPGILLLTLLIALLGLHAQRVWRRQPCR